MLRRLTLTALCFAAAACQNYTFDPVKPLAIAQTTQSKTVIAKQNKPNVVLLIDQSGSMRVPINPGDGACPAGCGVGANPNCPGGCRTRISDLKSAMDTFLMTSSDIARYGMAKYPLDNQCLGTTGIDVVLPPEGDETSATLTDSAQKIRAKIAAISPSGGTPTGASIKFVGGPTGGFPEVKAPENKRDNFVLLLTDGLPNCNEQNINSCANLAVCKCTLGVCAMGTPDTCRSGCLDKDGVLTEIGALRNRGIRTIVVGFGSDTATGPAAEVLDAMADQGGFARACPNGTDAECGTGNTCNPTSKLCAVKYYQAGDAASLSAALDAIVNAIKVNPCEYSLESQPSDPQFVSVRINDVVRPRGTDWDLTAGKVVLKGDACDIVKTSTVTKPARVEVRVVESL